MGSVGKGLRPLFTSKSFGLLYSFTPVTIVDPNVLTNPYHPLYRKVLERLKTEEIHTPQLIVNAVATKKKVSKYSVVRNKAVRRVREATYEVLKERGYGKEGEPLEVMENGMAKVKGHLVGTLSFWVTMESVITEWSDLKKEVRTAIDKFIALGQVGKNPKQKDGYRTRGGYGSRGEYAAEEGHSGSWGFSRKNGRKFVSEAPRNI